MGRGRGQAPVVRIARFHVPEAAPGARLELPEHSAHHAREVLRLRSGSAIRVFDGRGNEYEANLDEVSRKRVSVRLAGATPARARITAPHRARPSPAQGRPHGDGDREGDRARRGRGVARRHGPYRHRRSPRAQRLAPGPLGQGRERRRRAMRPRGGPDRGPRHDSRRAAPSAFCRPAAPLRGHPPPAALSRASRSPPRSSCSSARPAGGTSTSSIGSPARASCPRAWAPASCGPRPQRLRR